MAITALLIGTAGMVLLLAAFAANLLGWWDETEPRYAAANLVGAGLLLVYAYALRSYPFLVLEAVWAGFAAYRLVGLVQDRETAHF